MQIHSFAKYLLHFLSSGFYVSPNFARLVKVPPASPPKTSSAPPQTRGGQVAWTDAPTPPRGHDWELRMRRCPVSLLVIRGTLTGSLLAPSPPSVVARTWMM